MIQLLQLDIFLAGKRMLRSANQNHRFLLPKCRNDISIGFWVGNKPYIDLATLHQLGNSRWMLVFELDVCFGVVR